jgi:hypothetical protein
VILIAIEPGRSEPVLPGELVAVANAHAALLGRVYQKEAPERPERLAAKALLWFLIEHDDPLPGVRELARCNESGQSATNHDYIRVTRCQ